MKKRTLGIILVVLMICFLTACGTTENSNNNLTDQVTATEGYPYKYIDSLEREVVIAKKPQRIISLVPNITEIVFALDNGQSLVGRTEYCNYPEQVSQVCSVGDLFKPNFEQIVALEPDLILASTNLSPESLAKLEELKIPTVIVAEENSFAGVYNAIRQIARLLNSDAKAEEIIKAMQDKVELVTSSVSSQDKPSVYYVLGYGKTGDYTAGRDTFIGQLIGLAGGVNAASDTEQWQYSLEKLLEKDPDLLICPRGFGFKEGLAETNGYQDLTAVREGRIYEINADLIERHGPRLAEGLQELAEIIHSGIVKED